MFYTSNTNEDLNTDEDIIDINDYLDKRNLAQNEDFIDQKNSNIEPLNPNAGEFLENLLANVYKKDKLVQVIINAKVKKVAKLPSEILKQAKLAMGNLKVKNNRLYVKDNIYVPDNKKL